MSRRRASGTLAELIGGAALAGDVRMRTIATGRPATASAATAAAASTSAADGGLSGAALRLAADYQRPAEQEPVIGPGVPGSRGTPARGAPGGGMIIEAVVEAMAILAAGFWAGMINVVVGSGTLVTFPTLLLFGYPPLVANISNNIGLVGGGLTGTFGYRRELRGRAGILRRLLPASVLGGITGAILLLVLPAEAFRMIVPVLIALGLVMVVWGPALQRYIARGRDISADADRGHLATLTGPRLAAVVAGVYLLGIYGGYFGAAQGVLLVGLMSVSTTEDIQSVTALKNLLTTAVNAVAAVTFMLLSAGSVDWKVVGLIATGATLGGVAGAHFGRRLPPVVLRALIVVVGVAAIARMLL